MKNSLVFVLLLFPGVIGLYRCSDADDGFTGNKGIKILINNELLSGNNNAVHLTASQKELSDILWTPVDYIGLSPEWFTNNKRVNNNETSYMLHSDKPVVFQLSLIGLGVLMDAKDSVYINENDEGLTFSGRGADGIRLQYEIEQAKKWLLKPTRNYHLISSLSDYFNWKEYLDKRLELAVSILDKYRGRVSPFVFDWVKANVIYEIEGERVETFMVLNNYRFRNKEAGITENNLNAICDSTLNGTWAKWLQSCTDCHFLYTWYFYQYNRIQLWRKNGFIFNQDSLTSSGKRRLVYYNSLKENYQGVLRERLLQYVVASETIKEIGFKDPVTEIILKDYYSQPGFPEYKQWMKDYENKMREKYKIAQNVPVK